MYPGETMNMRKQQQARATNVDKAIRDLFGDNGENLG